MSSSGCRAWLRRIARSGASLMRRVTGSAKSRWRSRFCFEIPCTAESDIWATFDWANPHSVSARQVLLDGGPGAPAYDAIHTLVGALRIRVRSFLVVVDVVPVGAPLPYVADDVVKAEIARLAFSYGTRAVDAVEFGVFLRRV